MNTITFFYKNLFMFYFLTRKHVIVVDKFFMSIQKWLFTMKSLWDIRKINKLVDNFMMGKNFEKIFLQ